MAKIKVLGFDPAFASWGTAECLLDTSNLAFVPTKLSLITTTKQDKKEVRVSSDNLRRACILHKSMLEACNGAKIIFSEIPTGTQSAKAAMGLGIATGILAAAPIPIIQVSPREVKKLATGSVNASKEAMIRWAAEKYPNADWLRTKRKGVFVLTKANEHLADALAVVNAGIQTDQFKQLLALWEAAAASRDPNPRVKLAIKNG